MNSSRLPVIPNEIWTVVLENYGTKFEDLIHLWTQCRQVSKQFKADVENTFIKQHLPVITIGFNLESAKEPYTNLGAFYRDSLEIGYIRLSTDRKMAVFGILTAKAKAVWAAWRTTPMDNGPCHDVQIRGHSRHVYIPHLALRQEGEVVFEIDWKELLDISLGKAHLTNMAREGAKSDTGKNAFIGSIRNPNHGNVLPNDTFVVFITPQQSSSDSIRITTRQKNPAFTYNYQRKPGDCYILIVNEGYEYKLEGVPVVRSFSVYQNNNEVVEADRAIQAYKDIYKDV